jgi:hypothetical protein
MMFARRKRTVSASHTSQVRSEPLDRRLILDAPLMLASDGLVLATPDAESELALFADPAPAVDATPVVPVLLPEDDPLSPVGDPPLSGLPGSDGANATSCCSSCGVIRVSVVALDPADEEGPNSPGHFRFSAWPWCHFNPPATISVSISRSGGATCGTDYIGTITSSSVTVPVSTNPDVYVDVPYRAVDDWLVEGNETVVVTITPSPSYVVWQSPATNLVYDNDPAIISVWGSGYAKEGIDEYFTFNFSRTSGLGSARTIPFTLSGTAGSADYSGPSSVTFAVGEQTKAVQFTLTNDSASEWTETVTATLTAGPGYLPDDNASTANVDIVSDDAVDAILAGLPESQEVDVGHYTPIDPEGDDARIPLQLTKLPQEQKEGATVRLSALGPYPHSPGAARVKVYTSQTGGTPIIGGQDQQGVLDTSESWASGSSIPSIVYLQPTAGSGELRDIHFVLQAVDAGSNPSNTSDVAKQTNWAVVSTHWAAFAASPLDANNQHNGGLRIFPDKTTPTDTVARDLVSVVATVSPAPPVGTTIHFGSFDPDDPYPDVGPPAGQIDTKGAGGLDNRGQTPGQRGTFPNAGINYRTTAPTDAFGRATVSFQVTQQPGDNFRVGASHTNSELDKLNDNTVTPNNAPVAGWTGALTNMLTVWRRLWVERDMMAKPPVRSAPTTIAQIERNRPINNGHGTSDVLAIIGTQPPLFERNDDEYEGGKIFVPSLNLSVTINANRYENQGQYLYVPAGTFSAADAERASSVGISATLSDDDDVINLPRLPDGGSLLRTAFANAYILPLYIDVELPAVDSPSDTVPFIAHLNDDLDAVDGARNAQSTSGF